MISLCRYSHVERRDRVVVIRSKRDALNSATVYPLSVEFLFLQRPPLCRTFVPRYPAVYRRELNAHHRPLDLQRGRQVVGKIVPSPKLSGCTFKHPSCVMQTRNGEGRTPYITGPIAIRGDHRMKSFTLVLFTSDTAVTQSWSIRWKALRTSDNVCRVESLTPIRTRSTGL